MLANKSRLSVFPVFIKVEDRFAVIVGDGAQALAKARLLRESNIGMRLVSPAPSVALQAYIAQTGLQHVANRFSPGLLRGAVLVFAATGNENTDAEIVAAARSLNILANAVDRPHLCDFNTPALVNRAPVAVAIGSQGTGPVLTQVIRARIEALLPHSTGPLATLAGLYRVVVDKIVPRGVARRNFWRLFFEGEVARHIEAGDMPSARRAATRLLKGTSLETGFVTLIPAHREEADLQTLRAVRALQEADLLIHAPALAGQILALARRDAERLAMPPSTAIGELVETIVRKARLGLRVVYLSARSGPKLAAVAAALEASGIRYAEVPGFAQAAPSRKIFAPAENVPAEAALRRHS